MVKLPPYLLIVEHVAELVEMLPPSVLRQVTVPAAFDSCMTSAPEPAVLLVFWIEAVNAEKVGDMLRARTNDETPPAMIRGSERCRFCLRLSIG
jgi:hypothetical protein